MKPPRPWILGGRRDLVLIIGAPLWIAPLAFVAAGFSGDREFNGAVMALGSLGHHLPGMLRAYGDRALFARFRTRFMLAPILLGAGASFFAHKGLHALVLLAFIWGVWHALMQSYGFARIYAAKSGHTDRLAARLDLALLGSWFLAAVVLSPLRLGFLVDMGATCGLPFPESVTLLWIKWAASALAGAATLVWIGALMVGRTRPDPRAVLLIAGSIGFWWFANVRVRHPLLGAPLFELFHDVQYLTIVWAFNLGRGRTAPNQLRPLVRAMFRPGLTTALIYLAGVLGYGALGWVAPSGAMGDAWNGLLAASQLLHFYYDGFIWKLREPSTAQPLGVAARAPSSPHTLVHPALWSAFALVAVLLGLSEAHGGVSLRQRMPVLAELVPDNGLYQFYAAEIHWERGEAVQALDGFRRSLALDPGYAPSRDNLALSLTELADRAAAQGDEARVRELMNELRRLRPTLEGDVARHADEELKRRSFE